jgi:acetaldehyde dehydrogenase/alcohol dehydrogenase
MAFLDSVPIRERAIVENSLETIFFPQGTLIIEQGDQGNGCYIIDEGRVRIEFDTGETDTDIVLNYLEPGMVMGEFSLLDQQPRSANAIAHTDVKVRWLSTTQFQNLCEQHPRIGMTLLTALCKNLIGIVRQTNRQLAEYMAVDTTFKSVDDMLNRATAAQQEFASWPEDRVDALLKDLAQTIADAAEELAEITVRVSGMGVIEHKVDKIRFACFNVFDVLADQTASGLLCFRETEKITEIASPMGVVFGVIPITNPVPTMIFKALICLKGRNSLIMSCHRKGLDVGNRAGEIMQAVLKRHGAPLSLIQWIRERTSRKLTNAFMRHKDVSFILATGGPSIVKAAYSSGTPSIGVGAGNAPVLICKDADPDTAAETVISSKSFDNGIICGSENNLVVDAAVEKAFVTALENHGAAVLSPKEINQLTQHIFDQKTGRLSREVIGQTSQSIARKAGIQRSYLIRLIVVPLHKDLVLGQYGQEKLAPILSLFTVNSEEQGIALCRRILNREGKGHTAIIHTHDRDLSQRFGLAMPASRILVNCPGSQGCIGLGNGLIPSLTLGCGTLGGTSTTENVNYKNVINIKRIAYALSL